MELDKSTVADSDGKGNVRRRAVVVDIDVKTSQLHTK